MPDELIIPDVLPVEDRLAKLEAWLADVDTNLLDALLRLRILEQKAKP